MVAVLIYSTTSCPYCKMLKDYLNEKGVSFTEKLVDMDEGARAEMVAQSNGFMGVPFSVVTKTDGTTETVLGFDKGKFDSILAVGTI